jgi:TatA/E family protein of Tat protein translocase
VVKKARHQANRTSKFVIHFARIQQPQYDDSMNLGFSEMIFLFFLALLIFGPKKLPEIGRQVGRALNEFKRASDEIKSQIQSEISKIDVEEGSHMILPPVSEPVGSIASGSLPIEDATHAILPPASEPVGAVASGSLPAETSASTHTELSSQGHDA